MTSMKLVTLSIALLAAPAMAQTSGTHELRWAQAGKLPTASYHPVKRNCVQRAAPIHLAGKTPLVTANGGSDCATTLATNEADKRSDARKD